MKDDSAIRVPPQLPHIGQVLGGRYRIESMIATGGMGVVMRAEHLAMERMVALKLLHPHLAHTDEAVVKRFHREVQLAKSLDHRNTIRLYDSGRTEDGLLFVAMEYLEGETLDELLVRRGALRVWRAVDIAMQILDGLAEAHARNFIHRDIKPSNVFVTRNRRGEDVVKLLDFGIAKPLVDAGADLTGAGTICGTPNYVAPEYLRSEPVTKACDVYAVGLILLEMLRGQRVFEGTSPMETMMMRLHAQPSIPFLVEESPLAGVIRTAVARQSADRYADADEMFKALRPVAERLPAELLARRVDRPGVVRSEKPSPQRTEGSSRSATRVSLHKESFNETRMAPRTVVVGAAALALLVALGLVVFVGANALVFNADPSLPSEDEAVEPAAQLVAHTDVEPVVAPMADATPLLREFVIDSKPLGARVMRGQTFVGTTPVSVRLKPDELPAIFSVTKDGRMPATVRLTAESSDLLFTRLKTAREPDKRRGEASPPSAAKLETSSRKVDALRPKPKRRSSPEPARPQTDRTRDISAEKVEKVLDELLVD